MFEVYSHTQSTYRVLFFGWGEKKSDEFSLYTGSYIYIYKKKGEVDKCLKEKQTSPKAMKKKLKNNSNTGGIFTVILNTSQKKIKIKINNDTNRGGRGKTEGRRKKKNWHESKFLIVKWMKGTTILCEHNFCIDLPNHLFNASFDDVYASRQFNGFP